MASLLRDRQLGTLGNAGYTCTVIRTTVAAFLLSAFVSCRAPHAVPTGQPAAGRAGSKEESGGALEALGNGWIGGFGAGRGVGAFLRVDFAEGVARLHPREDRPPLGMVRPRIERGPHGEHHVHFVVYDTDGPLAFTLRPTAPDVLEGTVVDSKTGSVSVRLLHAVAVDRKAVDAVFAGTYAVDGDPHELLFVESGRLFDTRDGSERRLFLLASGRALVGAGVGTAHPATGIARLEGTSLAVERPGMPPVVASRFAIRKEEIPFSADGTPLRGTLTSPPGAGPFPAVVFVHGSGHSTRKDPWENAMARVFASEGYAMFLYDKRGVGDSGGEYVGPGGRQANNVSEENLARLAGDARAAFATIAARKDVDGGRIGFFGLSQAGWIVPLAASGNPAVRFVIMISAPTVPTATQLAYQTLNGDAVSCLPLGESARLTREFAPRTGVDPAPRIAALDVPGLWIYGGSDPLTPFEQSMTVLERMKKRDFTIKLAPTSGHELNVVVHDTEDERLVSSGISPVAIEALRAWLRERAR